MSEIFSFVYDSSADYANYQVAAPQTNHSYSSLGMSSQQPQQHIPQQMQIQSQQPSVMQQPQYSSSSYNNVQSQSYTAYTSTSASGYDSNVDYSAMAAQPVSTADPYSGYSKPGLCTHIVNFYLVDIYVLKFVPFIYFMTDLGFNTYFQNVSLINE